MTKTKDSALEKEIEECVGDAYELGVQHTLNSIRKKPKFINVGWSKFSNKLEKALTSQKKELKKKYDDKFEYFRESGTRFLKKEKEKFKKQLAEKDKEIKELKENIEGIGADFSCW